MMYPIDANGQTTRTNDVIAWGQQQRDINRRRIALSIIGDLTVTTVFLGIDHAFGGDVPVLWETMVYRGDGDWLNDYQWRYTSGVDAVEGHERVCAMVASGEIE